MRTVDIVHSKTIDGRASSRAVENQANKYHEHGQIYLWKLLAISVNKYEDSLSRVE
jgi:hypothetical protein